MSLLNEKSLVLTEIDDEMIERAACALADLAGDGAFGAEAHLAESALNRGIYRGQARAMLRFALGDKLLAGGPREHRGRGVVDAVPAATFPRGGVGDSKSRSGRGQPSGGGAEPSAAAGEARLERAIRDATTGDPPDRSCLPGNDDKWEGYCLGVEEATIAAIDATRDEAARLRAIGEITAREDFGV